MATEQSSQFIAIPTQFARDPHVKPRAAKVYLHLMANPASPRSLRGIAEALGMHRNTVKMALEDLESAGYLQQNEGSDARG